MSLTQAAPRCGLGALAESVAEELHRAGEEVLGLLKERSGRTGDRMLRMLLTERLSAAAGRIVALLEREVEQYRRDLERQNRLLEAVLSPVVRLQRTDSISSHSLRTRNENQSQNSEADPVPPTSPPLSSSSDAAESSDSDKDWEDLNTSCDKETNSRDADEGRRSTHQRPKGPLPPHPCIICGKTFRHRGNLAKHAENHMHNPERLCGVCGTRSDSPDSLLVHLRSHRDTVSSSVPCKVCGKTFQNMETHMRSHTGVKPFTCDTCGKSFPRPGALRRHKKIHSRTPLHTCKVCGQMFSDEQQAQDHLKTHYEDKGGGSDTDAQSEMESKRVEASSVNPASLCCKVCGDSFHSQGFLRKHAESHCGETRNVCGVCGERVDPSDALPAHLQGHRETGGTCAICGKTFQNMETHMRSHTGIKPYRCTVCNKHFPRPGALRRHKKIHTGERPYACRHCGKAFIESSALKMHSRSHSWEQNQGQNPEPQQAPAGKEESAQVASHPCKVCEESFQNKSSLRKHAESHTEASACGVCGERPQPTETMTDHLQSHRDAGKICHICGKTYQNIKTHMRSHTGVKPYHCGVCGKSFPRPGALRRHKKIHSGERPYICEFCGKTFIDNGALRTHIRNHTGDKPAQRVSCETCGKSLASLHVLGVHKRIHTGEKPFLCRVCGKAFRQLGGLNAHMLTHTGEKPFSCNLCSKSFSTKGYLETHIRFHKKERAFSCHLCWKAFVTKNDLKKHLLTHTGEKPYSCKVCGKSYQEKRSRDVHMKVHFGVRLSKEPIRRQDGLQPDFIQL